MNVVNEETIVPDAAVVEDIEPDLVEQVDTETTEEEDVVDEVEEVSADAEPSESSTEKETDEDKDTFKQRIGEVTKSFRESERRNLELEQTIREMQVQKPPEPVAPGKTLADFEYDEAAYGTYLQDHAKQAAEAEVQQTAQQEKFQARQREFNAKEVDFATQENIGDYQTATRSDSLAISPYTLEALQSAEKGPELFYHLAKNPEVARDIYRMEPLAQAYELGRIEATKLVKHEKPPSVTKAQKPPPKIEATGNKVTTDPNKMSDAQFRKWREKQIANR